MNNKKESNSKKTLYVIIITLAIASLVFRILNNMKIEQTAILFVGIPSLISIILIKYSNTPKTAYGVVFKTITLFLLMSSILLGEGIVCIIFMAPIFYAVAGVIVFIYTYLKNINKLNSFVLIPLLLIISNVTEINKEPKTSIIKTKMIVNGVKNINNFNKSPHFLKHLPLFFKIGFPKPISINGTGTEIGDFRKIKFESNTKGIGALHLKIKRKTKNSVTFKVVEDNTHINHWLTWKEINISIYNNKNETSTIVWVTKFNCDLGPSWYFKPIEEYGVEIMNRHLINSFFNN